MPRRPVGHRENDKRGGERGEWHYSAEDCGQYLDGLVLEFSEANVRRVERLEPIVAAVAERWKLEPAPVPVEASTRAGQVLLDAAHVVRPLAARPPSRASCGPARFMSRVR